jgi:Glycosyl transferases group 1
MDSVAPHGKNIVLVCGFRIFPANTGGQVRTSGIVRALARMGHRVQLYSLAGREADYRDAGVRRQAFRIDQIEPNLTEQVNLGLGFGLLQTLGRRFDYPRVWQYQLLRRGLVPRQMRQALTGADIMLSDMPWCPPVPGPWSHKPWFLISHNLEYRLLEQANALHRRFAGWMRNVETAAPVQFRDIFACTAEDRDFFREHAIRQHRHLQLPIVGCGVDPAAYRTAPGTRERMRAQLGLVETDHLLIFSGSNFGPNYEAAAALREFCRAEAAFLAREKVYVMVVGSVMSAPVRERSFIATGRVPEVASYLAAADVGVNAVTRGSGSNVKLFEYMAAQLPIISTEFGVRGTQLQTGSDYLPYTQLRPAIERYIAGGDHHSWRTYAAAVWERHRASCDINAQVLKAIASIPEFQGGE